ncbi:MAG: arginyltransferase [Zavarzinella sp.]
MLIIHQFTSPPCSCPYLREQKMELYFQFVLSATPAEYEQQMKQGWRRFGYSMFHPVCNGCRACQSLRIPVKEYRPNRSQRRSLQENNDLTLEITSPSVTDEKLELYHRYHLFQSDHRGWQDRAPINSTAYADSFCDNPFDSEEWNFRLDGKLIAVGYVDRLQESLSAIYFYYDPAYRDRSLGTYNVCKIIQAATQAGLKYVYLGYYVQGCQSLEYKAKFRPNEVIDAHGNWVTFHE